MKKQQAMALFILFMFIGSSAAIALISSFPTQQAKEAKLIYDRPLSNSEEAPFLQKNLVIVKYFWSQNCEICPKAQQALYTARQELNNKIIIESINIEKWPDEAERLGIESVPAFYLKGKSVLTTNTTDPDKLIEQLCKLYFDPIDECFLIA